MPNPIPPNPLPPQPDSTYATAALPKSFTAAGPLRMPTMMLVEDSRYACEVLRLYARTLGLRLRRAADLATAAVHLRLYRPDIVLVDLGLPDGRGEELIAQLAAQACRPPLIIGTSGMAGMAQAALRAGADVFIEKPMPDIAAFRALLVDHFPAPLPLLLLPQRAPAQQPDPVALQDDLNLAAKALAQMSDQNTAQAARPSLQYLAGFLEGVGGCLGDRDLQTAAHGELIAAQADTLIFHENLRQPTPDAPVNGAGLHDTSPSSAGPASAGPSFRKLSDLVNARLRDMTQSHGI